LSRNVRYITDDNDKIIVDVKVIDRAGKSEWNEIEWVVWNVSLDPKSEFIKDGQLKYVVYKFDSSFQDKRVDNKITSTDGDGKFSINVMGWEERKFDIELHRNDGSILKMISNLKEKEQ
jgi:hypothetical protein